jgi:hypothetical protein
MSNTNPSSINCLALPPGADCFSSTVTEYPAFAKKQAADNPANPLPIMTTFLNN